MSPSSPIHIVGAGLAGSEAAWQIARRGLAVVLHEMRPLVATPVHKTGYAAELVCSNSFRSDDALHNAVGLLHEEMRRLNSLIMRMGDAHKLPAGGALAVDRDGFAASVTLALENHPLVTIARGEVAGLPPPEWGETIIATGPLTSATLAQAVRGVTGEGELAFFDALAPIVHRNSINMDIAWRQSRYDKAGPGGTGADYLNCPMSREQYETFVDMLLSAAKTEFREFELTTPYFEGCLPIEVMAQRGRETLRYGPMKPIGLTDPRDPNVKPYAVVQLRQDNALGTLFNMVGFQTKLRHGEQTRVFRTIPGLEDAEFARTRRIASQHLSELAEFARPEIAAEALAAPAFRRSDHRLRRLCRKRGDRTDRGLLRGRRAIGRAVRGPASDDGNWRASRAHHGRPSARQGRGGGRGARGRQARILPADEREFRPVPAAR